MNQNKSLNMEELRIIQRAEARMTRNEQRLTAFAINREDEDKLQNSLIGNIGFDKKQVVPILVFIIHDIQNSGITVRDSIKLIAYCLKKPDFGTIYMQAIRALLSLKITSAEDTMTIIRIGIIPKLITIYHDEPENVSKNAKSALIKVAQLGLKFFKNNEQVFMKLMKQLRTGAPACVMRLLLATISAEICHMDIFGMHSTDFIKVLFGFLTGVLKHEQHLVALSAISCMSYLVKDANFALFMLAEKDTIPYLNELLFNTNVELQKGAIELVCQLTSDSQIVTQYMVHGNMLTYLAQLLTDGANEIGVLAVRIINNMLMEQKKYLHKIIGADIATKLLSFIIKISDNAIKANVMNTLNTLLYLCDMQDIMNLVGRDFMRTCMQFINGNDEMILVGLSCLKIMFLIAGANVLMIAGDFINANGEMKVLQLLDHSNTEISAMARSIVEGVGRN